MFKFQYRSKKRELNLIKNDTLENDTNICETSSISKYTEVEIANKRLFNIKNRMVTKKQNNKIYDKNKNSIIICTSFTISVYIFLGMIAQFDWLGIGEENQFYFSLLNKIIELIYFPTFIWLFGNSIYKVNENKKRNQELRKEFLDLATPLYVSNELDKKLIDFFEYLISDDKAKYDYDIDF